MSSCCGAVPWRLLSVGCLLASVVVCERIGDQGSEASNVTSKKRPFSDDWDETPDFADVEAPHGGGSQDPPPAAHRPVGLLQESGEVVSSARHRHKEKATGGEGFHGQFEGHFDGHFLGDFHGNMGGHFEGMFADR
eukprot:TRINITY_DN1731_c2_g1_i1.p1 TRINITY_DN1731_c2_g1~~TRINITY_DN1731_c2_g1_i1.p1  ORF type:complete len:136 (+),score=19.32 TRINITY_DN1731_c2_g1_i1:81-488(+)